MSARGDRVTLLSAHELERWAGGRLSLTAAILTESMLELQLELFADLGRAFDGVAGRPDRVLSVEFTQGSAMLAHLHRDVRAETGAIAVDYQLPVNPAIPVGLSIFNALTGSRKNLILQRPDCST